MSEDKNTERNETFNSTICGGKIQNIARNVLTAILL